MRRVAQIMGMPVSIDIPGETKAAIFEQAFSMLREIDTRFSPFKEDSELKRLQTGRLRHDEPSTDMRAVQQACTGLEARTKGYFSPFFAGKFDPTGYVKGWAIAKTGDLLERAGRRTHLINIGGDILARSAGAHRWSIGLQHPGQPRAVLGMVRAGNLAVATSGMYVRGQHIFNPHTQRPVAGLAAVTVIGPDITLADAFATALFAMGIKRALDFLAGEPGYEALFVAEDLSAQASPGFSTQTVR